MKIINVVVFLGWFVIILCFLLACLLIHDVWIDINHSKSEDLFFPKLFENYCFYSAFDRDIKDEKIIAFECWEEMWGGSRTYAEIIMFCYDGCGPSGDIFEYPLKITIEAKKLIEKLEKEYQQKYQYVEQKRIEEIEKNPQQYRGFYYFKNILEKEYYRKHQKPLTEAMISHFYSPSNRKKAQWESGMLWYDYYSKILWCKIDKNY